MKNIHVLQTTKPSRVVKQKYDKIDRLCLVDRFTKQSEYKRFNIYITSDEEIKRNDWCFDAEYENDFFKAGEDVELHLVNVLKSNIKKIILTTDRKLIKDGVQAIDDAFLEWFVMNHTCEYVEVQIVEDLYGLIVIRENLNNNKPAFFSYKIIIPEKTPKEETLEEAAEKHAANQSDTSMRNNPLEFSKSGEELWEESKEDFIEGAKWQAEQIFKDDVIKTLEASIAFLLNKQKEMYSEEDLKEAFKNGSTVTSWSDYGVEMRYEDFDTWFKEFKKK